MEILPFAGQGGAGIAGQFDGFLVDIVIGRQHQQHVIGAHPAEIAGNAIEHHHRHGSVFVDHAQFVADQAHAAIAEPGDEEQRDQ